MNASVSSSSLKNLLDEYMRFPSFAGIHLVDVNQPGNFGDRPIHLAASRGNVSELNTLIRNGADVNLPGEHEYSAMHLAVLRGNYDAVRLLVKAGADLSAKNDDAETPFDLANICIDINKPEERRQILRFLEALIRHEP